MMNYMLVRQILSIMTEKDKVGRIEKIERPLYSEHLHRSTNIQSKAVHTVNFY